MEVFVFGSNLLGFHGAGASEYAMTHHRAQWGVSEGLQGQSYAIPVQNAHLETMDLDDVEFYVNRFIIFAFQHPEITFNVVRVACGIAGYKDNQISPLFANAPSNVILPKAWGGIGFDW